MSDITFLQYDDPVVLTNSCVISTPGIYRMKEISYQDVRGLIRGERVESAIGHQPIADILSTLLDRDIERNRSSPHQRVGQIFIAFKLNTRIDEGSILNKEDIERIGYGFRLIERFA